jgi:hypothetical protein
MCSKKVIFDGAHSFVLRLDAELYLLDNEPSAWRQQQLWIHRPPFGWPSDPPGRGGLPEASRAVQLGNAKS